MKHNRPLSTVVANIAIALLKHEPSGMAIEPIATMQDPDDEVEGDYSIRCAMEVKAPDYMDQSKRYMSLFEASIHMEHWMDMELDHFKLALKKFGAAITEFKHREITDDSPVVIATRDGFFDLHELNKELRKSTKH